MAMPLLWNAVPALAAPGWGYGNHMWFKPGSGPTNGTLYAYKNSYVYTSMVAGSGNGSGSCIPNAGRIPDGWYNGYNGYHIDNKNNLIKGRVWGLSDKDCGDGTIRTELLVHTEETANNGQYCPTGGDDPYCWEDSNDYKSIGCVKISHPNNGYPDSVGSLHSWWHNQVGGAHSTYYPRILYVGSSAPPPPS